MHRSGKGKNVASVLKYHGKMWYNFAVPHFAVPNFAPANPSPPPGTMLLNSPRPRPQPERVHEAVGGACADVLGGEKEGLCFSGNPEHISQPLDALIAA